MSLREQVRLLSMVDIFEPLSEEELEALGRRAPDAHVQAGEVFLRPWEQGERLYVLKRGRAQLYEVNHGGEELTLSVVEGCVPEDSEADLCQRRSWPPNSMSPHPSLESSPAPA